MNVDMSKRQDLFETMPIMKAIMIMSLPMVLSSLVTILYNLSDTFFVATLNDSLQTAAVTLSAPILLSFNIVNNLFGVGSSSSRTTPRDSSPRRRSMWRPSQRQARPANRCLAYRR